MNPDAAALPEGSVPVTGVVVPRGGAVVVTDLHLAGESDERTRAFAAFCDELDGSRALIVLGDLFEAWTGAKQLRLSGASEVSRALRRLSERGAPIHVIPGNRDALLDRGFESASGAAVHMEGFVVRGAGTAIAFVHGDALCTLDRGYQRLRRLWRVPFIRFLSRHAPLSLARRVAAKLRARSEHDKAFKLEAEKSIQSAGVYALARAAEVEVVVCGHAHTARDDGEAPRHIVVGEWGSAGDLLEVSGDGAITFDPANEPVGR